MKKILAVAALLAVSAGVAYSTDTNWMIQNAAGGITLGATAPTLAVKPSANVFMSYDATAGTGVAFSVGTYHGQGSKAFGTSSVDTKIYARDLTTSPPGTTTPITTDKIPTAAEAVATGFGTGWTASK